MKKLLLSFFLLAAFMASAANEKTEIPVAGKNLALKKSATASGVEKAAFSPESAVDGNLKTRWSSKFNDQQWFMLDLGKPEKVGRIVIRWEKAFAQVYKIQFSMDGKNWKDIIEKDNGAGNTETLRFAPQETRYIRFAGDSRGSWAGYSFWEFQVFEK